MKKQTEKQLSLVGVAVVMAVVLFAYIRHENHTIRMNGEVYTVLGLIEQEDNGKKFYMPIYQKEK
jgi:hypothetical protein